MGILCMTALRILLLSLPDASIVHIYHPIWLTLKIVRAQLIVSNTCHLVLLFSLTAS